MSIENYLRNLAIKEQQKEKVNSQRLQAIFQNKNPQNSVDQFDLSTQNSLPNSQNNLVSFPVSFPKTPNTLTSIDQNSGEILGESTLLNFKFGEYSHLKVFGEKRNELKEMLFWLENPENNELQPILDLILYYLKESLTKYNSKQKREIPAKPSFGYEKKQIDLDYPLLLENIFYLFVDQKKQNEKNKIPLNQENLLQKILIVLQFDQNIPTGFEQTFTLKEETKQVFTTVIPFKNNKLEMQFLNTEDIARKRIEQQINMIIDPKQKQLCQDFWKYCERNSIIFKRFLIYGINENYRLSGFLTLINLDFYKTIKN